MVNNVENSPTWAKSELIESSSSRIQLQRNAQIISSLLQEPFAEAMKIAAKAQIQRKMSHRNWETMARMQDKELANSCDEVIVDDFHLILEYLNQKEKGVVVTCLHMSDYLRVLLKLSHGMSTQRRINILRRKQASEQEKQLFKHFETLTSSVRILRTETQSAFLSIRALKHKEIVVALFDLSYRWGKTAQVDFLSHPMHLVRGPAEIACLANADLMMILCHKEEGVQKANACPIMRTSGCRNALENNTRLITRTLAQFASHQIRLYPDQWHHWHLVPEMLDPR